MSYIVLHMDKFKKEAVRGIQSHNNRERESRSNPDIDYERSSHNYDLHEPAAENYAEAIQNRIDDLLLVKAVRKDAVHMCGLIVSSDSAFFEKLSPDVNAHCKGTHHVHAKVTHLWGLCARTQSGVLTRGGREA